MGSISVALSRSGAPDGTVVEEMIRAAPHRGGRIKMVQHGSASLAMAMSEDREDAHLGVDGDVAVVLAGMVDNVTDVAREAGQAGSGAPVPGPGRHPDRGVSGVRHRPPGARFGACSGAWSAERARIIVFRDHLGFGPVFFGRDDRGVYVASEAKQVVAGAGIADEPDVDVCEEIYLPDLR